MYAVQEGLCQRSIEGDPRAAGRQDDERRMTTAAALIGHALRQHAANVALEWRDVSMSYADVDRLTARAARFIRMHVRPHRRVAVVGDHSLDSSLAAIAAL